MKISCGTDIIEIYRVKKSIERTGQKFLDTIYTKKEIEYCETKKMQKYQHYAARFAAKEAIFKAVSEGETKFQAIAVVGNKKGQVGGEFPVNLSLISI